MPSPSSDDRVHRTTELRHVSNKFQRQLSNILGSLDAWKQLMAAIPRRQLDANSFDESTSELKYKSTEMNEISLASKSTQQSPTMILLDEWGTSGHVRPTVDHLFTLLMRLELYRAADFVAVQMLKEPAPDRPATGPAARVDISLSNVFRGSPTNSATVSQHQDTLANQNPPNKLGPSEVQKVSAIPVDDLIQFSARQIENHRNFEEPIPETITSAPNATVNLIQFSANNASSESQVNPSITQENASSASTPSDSNPDDHRSHYGDHSIQMPMLQDLLPSQALNDISALIPQFSTLLSSTSSFSIPRTVNEEAQSSSGFDVTSSASQSVTSSSVSTDIPDVFETESSGMLPAMLNESIAMESNIEDTSDSGNIPLLSEIGIK